MKWIEALKEWNAAREGAYMVPRKGSPEHAEVTELMRGGAKKPYVPTGRSKPAGYVRLLWAKKVLKHGPDDYPPPSRAKSSAKKIMISKIAEPGETLVNMFGSKKQKDALAKRKEAAKGRRTARAATREAAAEGIEPDEVEALKAEMAEAAAAIRPPVRKPRAKKARAVAAAPPPKPKEDIRGYFSKTPTAPKSKKASAMVTVLPPKPNKDIRGFFAKAPPKAAKAAPAPVADTIEHIAEEEAPSFSAAAYSAPSTNFPTAADWKGMRSDQKRRFLNIAQSMLEADPDSAVPAHIKTAVKRSMGQYGSEVKKIGVPDVIQMGQTAARKKARGGAKKKAAAAPKKIRANASGYTYTADQAKKDKTALGVKAAAKKMPVKEQGQISVMMKIGNHTMVAEPQPATIKVRGNIGNLPADADYPTSGLDFSGFDNRPQATTAKQAQRKFNAEETKVKPLSELFMSRPQKGLVEEQLAGKGRQWWQRELQEF